MHNPPQRHQPLVEDRLTKAALRRLKELGLPTSLLEVEEFRDHFFRGWLMFVHNGDKIADVHLIEPENKQAAPRPAASPRQQDGRPR